MDQPQVKTPKNVFEQIVFGLEVVNNNVVDLYQKIDAIHKALFPIAPEQAQDATGEEQPRA